MDSLPDLEMKCENIDSETEDTSPDVDDTSTFYFESDHVALKNNEDYHSLLKAVCLLEVQRAKAIQDLEKLYQKRDEALQNPIGFVQKLQNKEDLELPGAQRVAILPDIAWDKYTSSVDPVEFGLHRHLTRGKNKEPEQETVLKKTPLDITSLADAVVVRGRIKDKSKSSTFNQLWTVDEQKRLEELLIQYPPEKVEAHRFAKIAKALGNRTPQQVASRIQKYFLKLAKANLPIPGRAPKTSDHSKKGGSTRYQRFYHQPSTFLQSYEPPVYMPDDDNDSISEDGAFLTLSTASSLNSEDMSQSDDEESLPSSTQQSQEYQELMKLKQLRKEKLKGLTQHIGYKCDVCDVEPIIGTRWHCLQCPDENSIDLCDNCVGRSFETELHKCTHRLEQIKEATPHNVMDSDYMRFMPGGYNYLDPNYMPAS